MGGMPQAIRAGVTLEGVSRALASYTPRTLDIPGFRRAAVLVPLIDDGGHLSLLLTVRSATLRSHAGQVALPGGRLEPGEDSVDAALRETREEVGLVVPREAVLGELNDHPSPAGYVARPVVAGVPGPQALKTDPNEVAEAFLVPLDELRALPPRSEVRELKTGERRRIYFYSWRDKEIWGFTGNVIRDLFNVLDGRQGEDPFAA
jgi:8-oxo-dGTP pyrophosphatase MutT (NUDIX family)